MQYRRNIRLGRSLLATREMLAVIGGRAIVAIHSLIQRQQDEFGRCQFFRRLLADRMNRSVRERLA